MNKAEAFKILELKQDASDEEIKKKFRKLAAKKHPDVNKSENATEEYKKLSEAYEYLKHHKDEPEFLGSGPSVGFGNINDFLNNDFFVNSFRNNHPVQRSWQAAVASTKVEINFSESILGCKKDITLNRYANCNNCSGSGTKSLDEQCSVCNGQGIFQKKQVMGNRVLIQQTQCNACKGTGKKQDRCERCDGKGYSEEIASLQINIPGGISTNQTLRLPSAGHLLHKNIPRQEAWIIVEVKPDKDMTFDGTDVISVIKVSLLDALKGTTKKVRTILGDITLNIRSGVRNKDVISLNGYGVNKNGSHKFILDVEYPENDVKKLIETLEQREQT